MNTVTFGGFNSFDDLGLVLNKKAIGAPPPKYLTADIPCGDGELDYTEWDGIINYANRTLTFEFTMLCAARDFAEEYSRLQNRFNGRKMQVVLSNDPDFYYVGRITVNDFASEKNIGKVVIDVNAEPYKRKLYQTVIYREITGETVINCKNLKERVIPRIIVSDGEATVTCEGYTESVPFTGDLLHDIILNEGDNLLTVKPTGAGCNVTVIYREGSL